MASFIRRIFGKETHEEQRRAVSPLSPNMNCLPSASSPLAHNRGGERPELQAVSARLEDLRLPDVYLSRQMFAGFLRILPFTRNIKCSDLRLK